MEDRLPRIPKSLVEEITRSSKEARRLSGEPEPVDPDTCQLILEQRAYTQAVLTAERVNLFLEKSWIELCILL